VLAAAGADYVITRNMLAALVPLLIVLAAGFGARAAGRLGIAGAAALCALSVALVVAVPLDARYQRSDWRAIAEALGPAPASRAIVISPASDTAALEHYLGPSRRLGSTGFPYSGRGRRPASSRYQAPRERATAGTVFSRIERSRKTDQRSR
jgi:hypothetical protein